jgi:TonB family protein
MRRFALAIIFGFSLTAWSQERITKVVPRTYSLPIPQMDKGKVEGRTYRNPSIGLELTPAPELEWGTPETEGPPGAVPVFVKVDAWGEQKLFSARNGTVFCAEALSNLPTEHRSTEAYMRMLVSGNQKDGFDPVQEHLECKLDGVTFLRTDFKKDLVYEAVLVKTCNPRLLLFIFTGADRDAVNRLIVGTDLMLDGPRSGCGPSASGTKKTNPPLTESTIESQTPPATPGPSDGGGMGAKIYRVGGGVSAPVPIFKPEPAYSQEARKAKLQGTVGMLVVIDATGTVTDCKVVKPLGMGLDEKAIETVRTWKFKPALKNGTPVPVRVFVELTFRRF